MNGENIDIKIEELKKLCSEIDPFAEISKNHKKLLKKYGIKKIDDPFQLSNQLILLIENALEQKSKMNDGVASNDTSNTKIH